MVYGLVGWLVGCNTTNCVSGVSSGGFAKGQSRPEQSVSCPFFSITNIHDWTTLGLRFCSPHDILSSHTLCLASGILLSRSVHLSIYLCIHSSIHRSIHDYYYSKKIPAHTTRHTRLMPMALKRPSVPNMCPPREWIPSFYEIKSSPRNTMARNDSMMIKLKVERERTNEQINLSKEGVNE